MKELLISGGLLAAFLAVRSFLRSSVMPEKSDPWPTAIDTLASAGVCDPSEKPGPKAFRAFVLDRFGGTDLGISRACAQGGASEHKEGRAWDWGIRADKPDQKAAAEALITFLGKSDFQNARRLGIGIIIWDRKIWSAWKRSDGWRPYSGADPHNTHMHLSWSQLGAMAKTSGYKEGRVVL